MKVAGFTIIRNAVKCDYPVVEAITSVIPLCDEFVVAVGKSEDQTLELVPSIPAKSKLLKPRGRINPIACTYLRNKLISPFRR